MDEATLKKIEKKLKRVLDQYKVGVFIIIQSDDDNGWHYMGNMCPVCVSESMVEWVDDENISHSKKDGVFH